tara:strand:- start:4404 stop:4904 length:501 start_codon:yes stop_codon:yes gene_type:complete
MRVFPLEFDQLTAKQCEFVLAYVGAAQRNATEAARIAGYKGNKVTLAAVGAENLRKPQIIKAMDAYMRPKLEDAGINTQRTLQHIADIAYAPWQEFIDVPGPGLAMLRLGEKLRALCKLCDLDPNLRSLNDGNHMTKPHLSLHYEPGNTPEENRKMLLDYLRRSSF